MSTETARVPTEPRQGWSVDTALDHVLSLLAASDKRYEQRFEAQEKAIHAALMSVKEQTKNSFDASEKAIVKAEEAQKAYNQSHNDLARKMDDQSKATMPRTETESRFRSLEEKINELKEFVARGGGEAHGVKAVKDESRANIAIVLSFLGMGIAVLLALLK